MWLRVGLVIVSVLVVGLAVRFWWVSQYDSEYFDCVDMSYSIAQVFHAMGFDTKVIYGGNNDSAHCWLSLNGVYFDATSLSFSSESEYARIDFVDSYPYGYWDELGLDPNPPHMRLIDGGVS